jgi:hypothetical protein
MRLSRWASLLPFGAACTLLAGCAPPLFGPATTYDVPGSFLTDVAAGDLDRDGDVDVVGATTSSPGNLGVLRNNGDGTFATALPEGFGSTIPADPADLALGDVNRDGVLDLVVASRGIPWVPVLLGAGDGTFADPTCCNAPAGAQGPVPPQSVAVADLDRDGKPDLAVVAVGSVFVYRGGGDGTFAAPVATRAIADPRHVAVGDLTRDGRPDLVVARGVDPAEVVVLRGTGSGFAAPAAYGTGRSPKDVVVADVDVDGKPDVVTAGQQGLSFLRNSGNGTLAAAVPLATGGAPEAVVVADFDRDGRPDLAAANRPLDSNDVVVLLATEDGGFAEPKHFTAATEPMSLAVADFDDDGRLDLAAGNQQSADVSIFINSSS